MNTATLTEQADAERFKASLAATITLLPVVDDIHPIDPLTRLRLGYVAVIIRAHSIELQHREWGGDRSVPSDAVAYAIERYRLEHHRLARRLTNQELADYLSDPWRQRKLTEVAAGINIGASPRRGTYAALTPQAGIALEDLRLS